MKTLLWMLTWLVSLGLIMSMLAPHVEPHLFPWLPLFGLVFPFLFIANVLLVVNWLLRRSKKVLLPLSVLVVSLLYVDRFFGFASSESQSVPGMFTVATYNMGNARAGYDRDQDKRNTKRQKLEKYLDLLGPADIICIQEKGAFATDVLQSVFDEHNHYTHKDKGAAILTRYDILDQGVIDFGTKTNSCLWADLKVAEDILRVYSVHLQSNMITNDAKQVIRDGDLQQDQTWQRIRRILRRFTTNHQTRVDQSHLIAEHIAQSPHPVLLCGDLNDTPMSYTYEVLTTGLKDSFLAQGKGLASTYADDIPFLRIDYVLAGDNVDIIAHDVKPAPYSDHYPVVVTAQLRH